MQYFYQRKNINGWCFSYYLDFEDNFLNFYLKRIDKTPNKRASEYIYVKFEQINLTVTADNIRLRLECYA